MEFDPEEDEPTLEAAWPHLQVMLLQSYVMSNCLQHIFMLYVAGNLF